MKEKNLKYLEAVLALSLITALAVKREWLLLAGLCVFVSVLAVHGKWNRNRIMEELAQISEMMEQTLQGRELGYPCRNEDTLFDKIRMQILRIGEIHKGHKELLEKERDGIKELLAEISHQLRTPLANMETYLALADGGGISEEESRSYIRAIGRAEQKIKFLTEKFIMAARLESRVIQIHKFRQDLKQTAAEAIFQAYKLAERKQIYIEMKEKQDMDADILHDRNWLCEGIYNLLENSIKYSQEGSKVQVILNDNEMFTEIAVEDEGIGIDPGEENRIFQLYYRGKNISGQEGYGMGLFITRQIAAAHDGFVRVKRKQKGLKVSIFLPKTGT